MKLKDCVAVMLFTARNAQAVHFQTYSRLYNNLFAFTSLGGSFDAKKQKEIYVFKAHGQVYHNLPDLIPMNNIPKYLQLYFYDAQHEKNNRLGLFPHLQEEIITLLMSLMDDNPYGRFFRSLREIEVTQDTRIMLNTHTSLDQRVYNAPTSDEVAAVWLDSTMLQEKEGPHIVAYGRAETTHQIKHFYGCYDPLQYPLLLPKGESGWHQGLKKVSTPTMDASTSSLFPLSATVNEEPESLVEAEVTNAARRHTKADKRISCREYYAYKLQIRPGNLLLRGGRLFQQFIVDMYVKIENTRLDFIRLNQDTIRADLYQGILDTLELGENSTSNVGRRMILPPSFLGGPRDMRRCYLNAMALVQKYGKPDIFLTMTCNPNWIEIKTELAPGEQAHNRPDLVARIFHAKLTALRKEIMERKVFGEVAAVINVVEFQKRGLPHAHFLIILRGDDKIRNPESFDRYVSAEIPSRENPHLRGVVLRHMMHGPCGKEFPKCQCMQLKKGKRVCKSEYPKKFSDFTTNGSDCYPLYRRRDTGKTVLVRKVKMENRSVIPYNPYLLAMFDCHLNVEVCSTIKIVKYLYKYVYKGHDRISFNVAAGETTQYVDEIERYQSGRWVSPPEAAWRIFGFNLFDIYPPVHPLPVYTPNGQTVSFEPHETLQGIVEDEHRIKTMLTEFFKANSKQKGGPKYLYSEFPEHFVWNGKRKEWKARDRGVAIGRVAHAAPGEGERYYLRLLLAHVRGPTSFEDLLTFEGIIYTSFQEAALKRGILEQDNVADHCMDEAVQVEMPHALRRLFATILIFSCPNNPKDFWERYYEALSEDFRKQIGNDEHRVLQLTAGQIEQFLEGMGRTFADFNLQHLQIAEEPGLHSTRDIEDALNAPVPHEQLASRKKLNAGQKNAYKTIMYHVKNSIPGAFFIDGPGGTGKTFLYGALYAKVRAMGKICLPTATSGIAASNLPTGRTTHSRFKLPLDTDESLACAVPKQGSLACLLREASLIIWDEASMAKKENIEAVNLLLQDVCSNSNLFGGKIVVFGGDFRQVLPVLPRRTQQEAVETSIVSSKIWPSLTKFSLTENIRARADPEFSDFLLRLGDGLLQSVESSNVNLPPQLILHPNGTTCPVELLVDSVFPEVKHTSFSPDIFTDRAILTPRNNDVDLINKLLIEKFPGQEYIYKSFDRVIDDSCNVYPSEFLNTLCPPGMTPHELVIKENSPVILLRSLDPAAGLCNGTRLICKKFFPNMVECEISTGYYTGERVFLPRITLKPSKGSKYPINFERRQFPIKLSFAMTINKAQGQTLERVGVYLPKPCFSHGQLYVALSRARSAQQLKVLQDIHIGDDADTSSVKNIVSFEMLRRAGIRSW
ncbi:uncharacterized protein LOC141627538 [Silene latifolia]|uniref:uncharacterized protein LOC141627538 n=1 Tax=Silene latifolia TaxID=37657 RepID=UPI003D76E34E